MVGREGGSDRCDRRRRRRCRAAERRSGLDRRWASLERAPDRRRPDRVGCRRRRIVGACAARACALDGRTGAGPACRGRSSRRTGQGHRSSRLRQDARAHRTDAPRPRRSRLQARGRDRRRLQQARPERARDAPRGARAADANPELARVLAPEPPPRHPQSGPQRTRGEGRDRPGLPDPAATAHEHRPGRPLPRCADRRQARADSAIGSRGDARRRPRLRRRLRRLPQRPRGNRRDRLRRTDLRGAGGPAPRWRVPPARPAGASPSARRRVPGSDPGTRPDDPAARDAGVRRVRGRRRRPDDLRPRRGRPAVPRRLLRLSSRAPSSRRSRSTTAARRRSSTAPPSSSATTASGSRR